MNTPGAEFPAPDDAMDTAVATIAAPACFALLGNPNTGKTTLFNRLCGIRAKTANFPGSTVEARIGRCTLGEHTCQLVDLPGLYGLNLDRPESRACREYLNGEIRLGPAPEAALVVADATNLRRNLIFVSQALQQDLPAIVVLTLSDEAERRGTVIDVDALRERLGCPVVAVSGRTGAGFTELRAAMMTPRSATGTLAHATDAAAAQAWARDVFGACATEGRRRSHVVSDRIDAVCTHPIVGLLVFMAVMTGLFYAIFTLASPPMDLIEYAFQQLGSFLTTVIPAGQVRDLLVDGVIGGVAGTLVFLPQICLLFFLISILEDTGYLARAVFVTDRLLRKFGLPGQAFVPLLSAHACAIPAIMSARLIPDRRDRIATVLVAPFMSCSARLPVYVLLVGVLFADNALWAGLAFAGCFALGAVVALLTALVARRTILRGPTRPLVLELPPYRLPSVRTALLTTFDRALTFLRKAGTVIVAICIVLWWLSAYPATPEPESATALRAEAETVATMDAERAETLEGRADALTAKHAVAESFAGRIGRGVAPVFEPIGLDWQLTVAVLTSFAAREVFVSTLAVIVAGGDDAEDDRVLERIRAATRDDGTFVFTSRTAASLLVFYVLAMQCLPTLPITAREAGHWGWALLQLVYMSGVAYIAALAVYVSLGWFGVT
ncbi:MAG: ferrous iron transport protein B [Planctomycetes bacterium]|nr:ferrous iron transport protein B [Planctomycetota bacterium]